MNTDKLYAEQLANEYAPKNASRVVALRKLDAKAKLPATAFTYAFGITSALIFGTGLCLAMGQIGSGTTGSFVLGILMGVVGMAVNFLYVAFRIAAGIRYASVWFLTMAVYYLVLGGLRCYLVVCYRRRSPALERRCYRAAAWLLFLLHIAIGGMIALMVRTGSGFSYPGSTLYLSALYAFYSMTASIINLAKFRRLSSPILSAAKVLNLISAMMSILGLQTAMLSRFAEDGTRFRIMMNTITGGSIYGIVIVIALYMLLHSRPQRKEVSPLEPV